MAYVLDRFEENSVVLIADSGDILTLPAERFTGRREGDVFITDGVEFVFDEPESLRRRAAIRERFAALRQRKRDNTHNDT